MRNFKTTKVAYEVILFLSAIVFAVASPALLYSYMKPTYSLVIVVALCVPLFWRGVWKAILTYRYYLRYRNRLVCVRSKILSGYEFFKGRETAYRLAFHNQENLYHTTQGVKMAVKHRGYIYTVSPPGMYKHILMVMKEHGLNHVPSTHSQGILIDSGIFITMDQHAEATKKQAKL